MPRRLIAAATLAALWLVCGWMPFLLQQQGGSAATLARMIPSPMRGAFFGAPLPWAVALQLVAVLAVAAVFAALSGWFARDRPVSFAAGWLAAILTGFIVGAVLDLAAFVTHVSTSGVGGAWGMMGSASLTLLWAFLVGWVPALILRGPVPARPSGRPGVILVTMIAVLAVVALPFLDHGARAATQQQLVRDRAAAQAEAAARADPDGAAARDPQATGVPVPQRASAAESVDSDACTPENSTLLAPPADAATGHRVQVIELFNSGDRPCTVSGYPDVAFGDENSHLLDVDIVHGSSFMASDRGAHTITVGPGGTVSTELGWDANSVRGELAARTLWAASVPGVTRLSWPVTLDIIPGTTVHVTARHGGPTQGG